MVKVLPVKDGGNPRSAKDIQFVDDGFLIVPFSEDGDANYKFRLNVALINDASEPVPTRFTIEWEDSAYSKFRNYVLLTQGEDWQKLSADIQGTQTSATIPVPPGESRLGLHPPYGYGDFRRLVDNLPEDRCRARLVGKSLKGRDILAIESGSREARPVVIMARVHPYETIGSYFTAGMLLWIAEDVEAADELLANRRVIFVPMPNPDGVAEGNCKRTLGGDNIGLAADSPGVEAVALKKFMLQECPIGWLDMHGFMHNSDGSGTNDAALGEAVQEALKAHPDLFDKPLRIHYVSEPEGGTANLGGFLQKECGTKRLGGSWSWYERSAEHLRKMGVEILKAYLAQF